MMSLKGNYQFCCDARTFLRLHKTEAWNDVMKKISRLRDFVHQSVLIKSFKKGSLRFILLD